MKKRFKSACGLLFFFIVRGAERLLSVRGLHRILKSFVFARAVFNTAFKKTKRLPPLPDFLRTSGTRRTARQSHQNRYLNHFLEFFPERLAETKWMDRCRIEGFDRLLEARQGSRPVVLAFCHFGSYFLLRFWLRAAGFPAATFVGGNPAARTGLMRFKDRFSPFPEIPTAFYQDQLREAAEFLAAGNPLLVSIDMPAGKQMSVPVCEGWSFKMATGAIRLSIRHRAELIPCSIVDEGRWRFHIELGRPVPGKFLAADADLACAGKHLLDELLPRFRNHPRQCLDQLIQCFQPASPAVTMENQPDKLPDSRQFAAR